MDDQSIPLKLGFWFCQLLLYRTSLRAQPDWEKLVGEVIKSARLIVSTFLQVHPHAAVDFIDHIFVIAAYAALTLCEIDLTDPLIDQIQIQLIHISPNEEHIAYRFACVIHEVKRRSTCLTETATQPQTSPPPPPPPNSVLKSSPQHFIHSTTETSHDASVPVLSSSPLIDANTNNITTISDAYSSLQQLLTGFAPVPLANGMTATVVNNHHQF